MSIDQGSDQVSSDQGSHFMIISIRLSNTPKTPRPQTIISPKSLE